MGIIGLAYSMDLYGIWLVYDSYDYDVANISIH